MTYGHEQLAAGVPARARRCGSSGSRLSHRALQDLGDLGHVLVASARQVEDHGLAASSSAARSTHASAWADSSAAMMPSVRASTLKASSTSASVTFS